MNKYVLTNPSEAELASAVQENLFASFRSMQVIAGCELVENASLNLHHAFPGNPIFKGVWKTRFSPAETETKIDEVLNWFDARGAHSFFWWTDPETQPPDLVERLMRRGFDGDLEGDPGMVMNLHDLSEDLPTPGKFNIVKVMEQKSLEDWRDAFAEAFEMPISGGQAWVDATNSAGLENAPWQMYVGYLDRKPVSSSILFLGAGVAGVYGVGTIPEARNQGIGAAMTLKPLRETREQGYHFAVLSSS